MAGPEIVRVEGVSKRFVLRKNKSLKEQLLDFRRSRRYRDDFWALKDIGFSIDAGSTVGLIGHNGSGKSTLLKVIGGIIEPTTGVVSRRGRIAALLELGAGFHPDLTGRENVYLNASILGLSRAETASHFDEIVEFSGVEDFIDTQVKFYSSGMYVRLAFAVAVHVDPDLLLVDEVLAVGDEPFQRKCMDKVAQFQREGRTIVLVSHSAEQIGRVCDRALLLNGGELTYDGKPPEALRQLRHGFQEARLKEIDRMRQSRKARGLDGEIELRDALGAATMHEVHIQASDSTDGIISQDSSITFTLDCEIFDPSMEYDVGIGIETAAGLPVYQLALTDFDKPLAGKPGPVQVSFTIPKHHLGAGQYVVNAAIARYKGEVITGINPGLWFDIGSTSGVGQGVINVQAAVQITDRD